MNPVLTSHTPGNGDDVRSVRRVALRALTSPWSLLAVTTLLVNDHLLKSSDLAPAWLTGKLSDVAGLVFFPLLLTALLAGRRARGEEAFWTSVAVTGIVFIAINTAKPVADAVEWLLAGVGVSWRITTDPSDLLALPALVGAALIMRSASAAAPRRVRRWLDVAVVVVAATASLATSCDDNYPAVTNVVVDGQAVIAEADWQSYRSVDGGETWEVFRPEAGAPIDDVRQTEACLAPDQCFRIVSPLTVEERTAGGEWIRVFHISPERVDYMARANADVCSDYRVRASDIVALDDTDPVVVVAAGDTGLLVRHSDGRWERGVLPDWVVAPEAELGRGAGREIGFGWAVALLASMLLLVLTGRRVSSNHGSRDGFWWGVARLMVVPGALGVFGLGDIYGVLAVAMLPAAAGFVHLLRWIGARLEGTRGRILFFVMLPIAGATIATGGWILWQTAVIGAHGVASLLAFSVVGAAVVAGVVLALRFEIPEVGTPQPAHPEHMPSMVASDSDVFVSPAIHAATPVSAPERPSGPDMRDEGGPITMSFARAVTVGTVAILLVGRLASVSSIWDAHTVRIALGSVIIGVLSVWLGIRSREPARRWVPVATLASVSVPLATVGGSDWGLLGAWIADLTYTACATWLVPPKRGGSPRRLRRLAVVAASFPFIGFPFVPPVVFLVATLVSEDKPSQRTTPPGVAS